MNITHEEVVASAKESVEHVVRLANEVADSLYRSVYVGELSVAEIMMIYREVGADLSESQLIFLRMAERAASERK